MQSSHGGTYTGTIFFMAAEAALHAGCTVWLCLDLLNQLPLGDALVAAAVNILDLYLLIA